MYDCINHYVSPQMRTRDIMKTFLGKELNHVWIRERG